MTSSAALTWKAHAVEHLKKIQYLRKHAGWREASATFGSEVSLAQANPHHETKKSTSVSTIANTDITTLNDVRERKERKRTRERGRKRRRAYVRAGMKKRKKCKKKTARTGKRRTRKETKGGRSVSYRTERLGICVRQASSLVLPRAT